MFGDLNVIFQKEYKIWNNSKFHLVPDRITMLYLLPFENKTTDILWNQFGAGHPKLMDNYDFFVECRKKDPRVTEMASPRLKAIFEILKLKPQNHKKKLFEYQKNNILCNIIVFTTNNLQC